MAKLYVTVEEIKAQLDDLADGLVDLGPVLAELRYLNRALTGGDATAAPADPLPARGLLRELLAVPMVNGDGTPRRDPLGVWLKALFAVDYRPTFGGLFTALYESWFDFYQKSFTDDIGATLKPAERQRRQLVATQEVRDRLPPP